MCLIILTIVNMKLTYLTISKISLTSIFNKNNSQIRFVLQINLSYSSAYVWDLYVPTWNHITELDLGFALPNSTQALLFGKRKRIREKNELHRAQRRDLFYNIESMFYM